MKKPWHILDNCLLLKELNLELVNGPPSLSLSPALAQPLLSAPSTLAMAPSSGGRITPADDTTVTGSAGSSNAPSGLMVVVEENFDSDDEFCWAEDDDGQEFWRSSSCFMQI